ncbi:hypothetical protein ACLKA7_013391 [Drosophila subpalustris]
MEQYKLINAQLMDQVQSQRKMISQLREEEVILKRNWMEEHEKRIAEAQFNENRLKSAIMTLLSSLDINLDFNCNSASPRTSQAFVSEERRSSRSNSNRISSEFRRSSVLLQNSVPISPSNRNRSPSIRKSSVNALVECSSEVTNNPSDADEETIHLKTPEPRHLHELQGYTSSPSSPEAEGAEEDKTLRSPAMTSGFIYSIMEESEELDVSEEHEESEELEVSEEHEESEVTTLSSTIEHVEAQQERIITVDTKKASPLPFRDVTNKSARPNSSPKITKARGKSAFFSQTDAENDIQETLIEHVRRGPKQSSPARQEMSPKKRALRNKLVVPENESDCENLEPTIEHVRHATRQSSPIQPFPSSSVGCYFSPRRSQLNFERFNGICRPGNCSTPRQEPNTLPTKRKAGGKRTKSTVNSTRDSEEQSSSNESTLNGRPSRSCRPKSLKEPSSRTKLRNETAAHL